MNVRILLIIALATMVGSMVLVQQASAEFGERKVWMTITNTRTDTVKTIEWTSDRFLFESSVTVDVHWLQLKKIKDVFGTNKFTFTWQSKMHEVEWHHFKVTINADTIAGSNLRITFI